MSEIFYQKFLNAVSESCSACLMQKKEQDDEYRELDDEFSRLLEEMQKTLGENRKLLMEFERVSNRCNSLEVDWIYQQGFRDCLFLLKWMGAFA